MLATQTLDTPREAVQQIKEKFAQSLKALQKRYITSDAVVTSEDSDANLLCCVLEAVFIHGLKRKYIRLEAGGRSRKRDQDPLPQPFFWSLLKTVTHRDVIIELEKISFVGTDIGRCRAWLRLALNHGLLECYLASLFREDSKLQAHYQPSALLLNAEEREVLLSYLQGLASLTFNLSYKSAVLNEWTTTPLALAGLCPFSQVDTLDLPRNGGDHHKPMNKDLWDTVSQSFCSSDTLEIQRSCPVMRLGRGSSALHDNRTALNSSNLSLDTTGSSPPSSSLSSDSLQQDPPTLRGEQWSSGDFDMPNNVNPSTQGLQKDSLTEFRESANWSQDSMHEDTFISSKRADQISDMAICSDSETQPAATPLQEFEDQMAVSQLSAKVPSLSAELPPSEEQQVLELCNAVSNKLHSETDMLPTMREPVEPVEAELVTNAKDIGEPVQQKNEAKMSEKTKLESFAQKAHHSISILSREDSLSHSHSWISEDDIYKPYLEEVSDLNEIAPSVQTPVKGPQSPPSVVHRRQIGLSNPFRGLLKLGHLERRNAMGMWRDYYCELSPFEFRLYQNAEERICYDNCSLVRCEGAQISSSEGRFDLAFPGKRLYLRAANHDEAEDWVDRIIEAVNKCRPASNADELWEGLQVSSDNDLSEQACSPFLSAPSSPECCLSSNDMGKCEEQQAFLQEKLDWTQKAVVETDAIKETVLYLSMDSEARTWVPLVFSLSLESLKGFRVQEARKLLSVTHLIEEIRDVVPEVSLGGPAFFKILTVKNTMRLRAENSEEARSWRSLIRGALDSYLESGDDEVVHEEQAVVRLGVTGNLHRLVQYSLGEDGALLAYLCTVPSEKGLDTQNFKCAGCPQLIGPSLGRAKLCEFSGQYYCESCHSDNTTIIPSRMVHNWDLTQREVSKKAFQLLAQVEHEPLLNLDQLNPDLVRHSDSISQSQNLRQRLRLMGDYLLTCRSGAYKKLQARMPHRPYLLESSHLYSVKDLRQIADGQYTSYLLTLLNYASNHVFNCDLCMQRGFICQICHGTDTIFPFQFETTTRCKACKAVFHRTCKVIGTPCPRCQRMRKYQERDLQG